MNRLITAYELGEQSTHKPLNKFGEAVVQRPVRDARAMAEREARVGNEEVEFDG